MDASIREKFERKPLAHFPAAIAVVRIQAPGYAPKVNSASAYGYGRYTVVTGRDIESDEHFARLAKLPRTAGIAPISRLLLQVSLQSDRDLREAAASLKADMVLIYTLDTYFEVVDHAGPVTLISLGLFPTKNAKVNSTAAAILIDTRNGYVYGVCEASARHNQPAAAWTSEAAVDQSRQKAERDAFDNLLGEIEKTWAGVVRQYDTAQAINVQ